MFLNTLSASRVSQVARSFACTPLSVFLLDSVFTGGVHPPGFKIHPTARAQAEPDLDDSMPAWLQQFVGTFADPVSDMQSCQRRVDPSDACCVVSLGGAAKTHLLDFFYNISKNLKAPQSLYVQGQAPLRREIGNFSALAIQAKKHKKIVYCPDEWGLAVVPARGSQPKGTSASQMMSMQETFAFSHRVVALRVSRPHCARPPRQNRLEPASQHASFRHEWFVWQGRQVVAVCRDWMLSSVGRRGFICMAGAARWIWQRRFSGRRNVLGSGSVWFKGAGCCRVRDCGGYVRTYRAYRDRYMIYIYIYIHIHTYMYVCVCICMLYGHTCRFFSLRGRCGRHCFCADVASAILCLEERKGSYVILGLRYSASVSVP